MDKKISLIALFTFLIFSAACNTKGQKAVKKVLRTEHAKVLDKNNVELLDVDPALKLATLLKTIRLTYPNDKSTADINKTLSQLKTQFEPLIQKIITDIKKARSSLDGQLSLIINKINALAIKVSNTSNSTFKLKIKKEQCALFNNNRKLDKRRIKPIHIGKIKEVGKKEIILKTILNTIHLNPESFGKTKDEIGKEFRYYIGQISVNAIIIDCDEAMELQKELLSLGTTFKSLENLKQPLKKIETMNSTRLL